ncbi:MAG: hypothetical protein AAF989_10695, partial [Planctomycetota bacterium]
GIHLVACSAFYQPDSIAPGLPLSWDTTTDSIAVRLAMKVDADSLCLLKSCEVNAKDGPPEWSEKGIVDAAFLGALADWESATANSVDVHIQTLPATA